MLQLRDERTLLKRLPVIKNNFNNFIKIVKETEKEDIEAEVEAEAVIDVEDPVLETEDITNEEEGRDPAPDRDHIVTEEDIEGATQGRDPAQEAEEVCRVEINHQRDMKRKVIIE
jgi:hypothetical protein